jgi:hypothetical protein
MGCKLQFQSRGNRKYLVRIRKIILLLIGFGCYELTSHSLWPCGPSRSSSLTATACGCRTPGLIRSSTRPLYTGPNPPSPMKLLIEKSRVAARSSSTVNGITSDVSPASDSDTFSSSGGGGEDGWKLPERSAWEELKQPKIAVHDADFPMSSGAGVRRDARSERGRVYARAMMGNGVE